MEEIGISEAKERFSELAQRVQQTGRAVHITQGGRRMVDIVPADSSPMRPRRTNAEAFAELGRIARAMPGTTMEQILADIANGRR